MDRTEAEDLVQVLEQNEVKKLMIKEKQKAVVEEQFSRKKLALVELTGKINLVTSHHIISPERKKYFEL